MISKIFSPKNLTKNCFLHKTLLAYADNASKQWMVAIFFAENWQKSFKHNIGPTQYKKRGKLTVEDGSGAEGPLRRHKGHDDCAPVTKFLKFSFGLKKIMKNT
jgi:hypothetical protein